jgi:two-component system NarL family sensor kinase
MQLPRPRLRWPRFDSRTSVARAVTQFVLAGLAAVVLVGVLAAAILRHTATNEAIRQAKDVTRLAGDGIIAPYLTPGVVEGNPAALARLDRVVGQRVLRSPVVRVKIWTASGRIVYSDEPRLIGSRYGLPAQERRALREGRVEAKVSDLGEPENRFERRYHKLLEVYLPIRATDGQRLLFESYSPFSSVAASGRRQWEALAPALIGSLLLLELVQVPLAWSLARRLRQRQREREALLGRALDASDNERRRIAAALHEGVVQDLAGLNFKLSGAAQSTDNGRSSAQVLREAAGEARQAMRKLRAALLEIYPPTLHRAGLAPAVDDLAATLVADGTDVVVDVPGDLRLPDEVEALLFQAAQEGLRNVAKHARARHVAVSVSRSDGHASLTVRDDGRGFQASSPGDSGHLGLQLLDGLARDAGGTLKLTSQPGGGTNLTLEVPVP